FQNFANTDGQLVALSSERVDFMFTNEAVVAVFVEDNPEFSARTPVYAKTPAGIAVPKGDGTAEAFKLALETLLEDGTIQTIFEKWGLGSQPLDEVIINYQGESACPSGRPARAVQTGSEPQHPQLRRRLCSAQRRTPLS